MSKTVYVRLGIGNLQQGFPDVEVRLLDANRLIAQKRGALPPEPQLANVLATWQFLHAAFYEQRRYRSRGAIVEGIELETSGVTSFSVNDFQQATDRLQAAMRNWLNAASMTEINNLLRTKLDEQDEIQVMIETEDDCLHRLPWHCWDWLRDFRHAEPVFNAPEFIQRPQQRPRSQCRILVVLGDLTGINTADDERLLHQLAAEVVLLSEPSRKQLSDRLRDPLGWDIFFFAGHSSSREGGHLRLNTIESVSIADLRSGLGRAIDSGLQLAIFNSCDGAALARDLAGLNIPTIVVMKESVPNQVAQEFLKALLEMFTHGRSLPRAVREARESLESLEPEFLCASWLPAIWHNPTAEPLMWQQLSPVPVQIDSPKPLVRQRKSWKAAIALSLAVSGGVIGLRSRGFLEQPELWAYDRLMQLQPNLPPDPRLLIVAVNDQDVKTFGRPLSDLTLAQVLAKLEIYQPSVIGLDIFRDIPVGKGQKELLEQLNQNDRTIAICKMGEVEGVIDPQLMMAPPPDFPVQRVGYADSLILDPDKVMRRYALAMEVRKESLCIVPSSFALQVIRRYFPKNSQAATRLDLALLNRLEVNFGSYHRPLKEMAGSQVMTQFRPSGRIAQTISVTDILQGAEADLRPLVQDRIVLIGYESGELDLHPTPIGRLYGVRIHAHVVSQLLDSAVGSRSVLSTSTWSEVSEMMWIGFWAMVAGGLAWSRLWRWQLMMIAAFGSLLLVSFLAFSIVWLPLMSAAIAFIGAASLVNVPWKKSSRKSQ